MNDTRQRLIQGIIVMSNPAMIIGVVAMMLIFGWLRAGQLGVLKKIALHFPWMLTPTPMWNLAALKRDIECVDKNMGDDSQMIVPQAV